MTNPTVVSVPEFEAFGFQENLLKGIVDAGFTSPSPIQKQAIPLILEGKDIIAQAQTGTGKTAAFGLPCLNKINPKGGIQVLILTPTRELASQVSDEIYRLGKHLGIRTVTIYGGTSYSRQISQANESAQIAVATPGRLLDLLNSKGIKNFKPGIVVLDEADEMLDMGFQEDIESIFFFFFTERQTLLFSATMPEGIKKLSSKYLKHPAHIKVAITEASAKNIEQVYYVIDESERDQAVVRVLDFENPYKAIVFTKTKKEADELKTSLSFKGYPVEALHGDLGQKQREQVLKSLHDGRIRILVATDVAARGLDVKDLSHVINYHLPFDPESYTHRIGRTGRAGKTGKAITFVTTRETRALMRLKSTAGTLTIAKVPSKKAVIDKRMDELLGGILKLEIASDSDKILEKLESQASLKEIALKLLSQKLAEQKISGPETIGKDPENWSESPPSSRRGSDGGKGRPRGDSRFSKGRPNQSSPSGKGERSARPPRAKRDQRFRNK